MTTFAGTLKRSIAALALLGAVSAAALGSGVAHAGPAPQIALTVQQNTNQMHVTGSGFGSGDPVMIYALDAYSHAVVTSVHTTATFTFPICPINGGRCTVLQGGYIAATTPTVYIHCDYNYVKVYAIDLKTWAVSNAVPVRLGGGPC